MAEMQLLYGDHSPSDTQGAQRLSVERLRKWQAMEYGMFIHYGLVTYNHDLATISPADFQPAGPVDTDQWARVARDAGMKYAIFLTQHPASCCMWHTKIEGVASVAQSPQSGDVVARFIESCRTYDIIPCFYFFGSKHAWWYERGLVQAPDSQGHYATRKALDGMKRQLDELLTTHGPVAEFFFDGPQALGQAGRSEIYKHVTELQPDIVFTYNGWGEDCIRAPRFTRTGWPSDVIALEVLLPPFGETSPWRKMEVDIDNRKLSAPVDMYIPVASYMIMQRQFSWFHDERAVMVSDADLLGMRLLCRARNANLVLNVAPDRSSRIPDDQVAALMRLRENWSRWNSGPRHSS